MRTSEYKVVLCPITVPKGRYCWKWTRPFTVCEHFDNEGGCPSCGLKLGELASEIDARTSGPKNGVLKAEACANLKKRKKNP